jgi:hypothetical protein
MFCSECGTQNPDTNLFCKNCGKPLPRRQPAEQQAVAAQPAQPAPAPVIPVPPPVTATALTPAPAPGAALKRKRNWLGIVSLILGILSWGILTVIVAIAAVLLGIISLFLFRKATGRTGNSSIIGIILGIAAIIVSIVLA